MFKVMDEVAKLQVAVRSPKFPEYTTVLTSLR
jgi:hypothetical protein